MQILGARNIKRREDDHKSPATSKIRTQGLCTYSPLLCHMSHHPYQHHLHIPTASAQQPTQFSSKAISRLIFLLIKVEAFSRAAIFSNFQTLRPFSRASYFRVGRHLDFFPIFYSNVNILFQFLKRYSESG